MGMIPSLMKGHVMHARLIPRKNAFRYGIYYLAFPLSKANQLPLPQSRWAALSFKSKDHGARDGSDLQAWAREILQKHNIHETNGEIILACMPCILGYVFNPVSFWFCLDQQSKIRAVLCEVHNTFGEHHTYICAHPDHRPIHPQDILKAEKLFHVSPFLERQGHYLFRFEMTAEKFDVSIDYYNQDDQLQLVTYLRGNFEEMTKKSLQTAFWTHPLVTLKSIFLIHAQAIKLLLKGIKYIPKPKQNPQKISASENLTKI